jgi:hypothetical protein
MRNFAVGNITPDPNTNELQRADIAPYATCGDGLITAGDTIQERRYVAGLDSTRGACGSTGTSEALVGSIGGSVLGETVKARSMAILRVLPTMSVAGKMVTVPLELLSDRNVAASGFTINFDSDRLKNPVVSLISGLPSDTVLTVNTSRAEDGIIAVLVDSGHSLSKDSVASQLIGITFEVNSAAPAGDTPLYFSGDLAKLSSSDAVGNTVAMDYVGGNINVSTGVPVAGQVFTPEGRGLRNARVTITASNGTVQAVTTSSLGYFKFENVVPGDTYTISVSSRLYRFEARSIRIEHALADLQFVGLE